ncbi:MAG: YybH family protein [Pyrinomonadaceae bacterium]
MDLDTERIRLLERDAQWARAASAGKDIELVLSYWTDDAIVLPPGLPAVVGKAALRQYVKSSLQIPGFKITWNSTEVKFSPDANMAFMFGRNSVSMDAPDGATIINERPRRHDLATRRGRRMALRGRHLECAASGLVVNPYRSNSESSGVAWRRPR